MVVDCIGYSRVSLGEIMRKFEEAVSPVVGVMLMLVITIIIAAVVSGFAGQFTGNAQSAPVLWRRRQDERRAWRRSEGRLDYGRLVF